MLAEGWVTCDVVPHDERVYLMSTLIRVDRLQVHHVPK